VNFAFYLVLLIVLIGVNYRSFLFLGCVRQEGARVSQGGEARRGKGDN